jgi:conjugative relaxase-like TrwC/TraI family protein
MFTAKAQKNRGAATTYFDEHLCHNDYYTQGEPKAGFWIGNAADRLGLHEGLAVNREAFLRLCDNQHPGTGQKLTQLNLSGRRIFFDFTCSAPKSVSILAVAMDDRRIMKAHRESANIAFKELEAYAGTRVRKDAAMEDRHTGNLVAAAFRHTSSRELDPQLHTHFTVFNATFDETEDRWKALQTSGMFDAIHYGTAVYRHELASRLHALGYQTRSTKHGFEIAGVDPKLINRFSKRSQQRDAAIASEQKRLKREKLSNNEVSDLVHKSRPRKLKNASEKDVRAAQLSELSFFEKRSLQHVVDRAKGEAIKIPEPVIVSEAMQFARDHVFARQSVAPKHKVLEAALVKGCGQIDLSALKEAFENDPELVRVGEEVSTRAILTDELRLIQKVNDKVQTLEPIAPDFALSESLGADQKNALQLVLSSTDAVCGVRGLAGTGKTTALKELQRALSLSGQNALFCAPTAAATDVLRDDGFQAVTLAKLLQEDQAVAANPVIVLDEAGAVSTSDMLKLLQFADRHAARIVLCGDTGQHASVEQGDALRIIEEHSQYRFATLRQIRRQRTEEYRQIVQLAAQRRPDEAFRRLERSGEVIEAPVEGGDLYKKAAAAYIDATGSGKRTLIVSPTWAEIEAVTAEVRGQLRIRGQIGPKDETFSVFDPSGWTDAQKQTPQNYEAGTLLRFVRKTEHFKAGAFAEVVEQVGKQLKLRSSDGREIFFHPSRSPSSFEVGQKHALGVASGDWLLLRANAPGGLVNGKRVQVKAVNQGRIVLTDDRTLPAGYRTFTHGYAVTSHSAQSKTVAEALLVASSRSFAAVSQEQFYVSISRARERVRIFTDDAELLSHRICASHTRKAAIEIKGLREALVKSGLVPKPEPVHAPALDPKAAPHSESLSREARPCRKIRALRPGRFHPLQHVIKLASAFGQWLGKRFGAGGQAQTLEPQEPETPAPAMTPVPVLRPLPVPRLVPAPEFDHGNYVPLPVLRTPKTHGQDQGGFSRNR